ncbi:MAG TPA: hypothetical protein VFJ43_15910, partial [Bacteroidia bacterium]|nr:hypothetical protein [Bacteroidia bacterium]
VVISEISNYPDAQSRIPKLLLSDAHLGFWETYSMLEIWQKLETGLSAIPDSSSTDSPRTLWNRFTGLIDAQSFQFSQSHQLEAYENCLIAYVSVKDTSNMNVLIELAQKKNILPAKFHLGWTALPNSQMNPKDGLHDLYGMIALKSSADGKARLDKPALTYTRSVTDNSSGGIPQIYFGMEGADADAWRRMTAENIHKSVAIVIDGSVYSWPTVQGEISGGVCSITGNFSEKEINDLVTILRSQSLPAQMNLVETNILP